jgi:ribose 5-phosphate isomerase B
VRIAVGSDHAGYPLKPVLIEALVARGIEVLDLGTNDATTSVDYPDFGEAVAHAVVEGRAQLGVAICGSGIGISIAANKVAGARAALVHDVTTARLAREHNHANVLCFGARITGTQVALDALHAWLDATPGEGRHLNRLAKIDAIDARNIEIGKG